MMMIECKSDAKSRPSKEYPYFLFDPENNVYYPFQFFKTEAERDEAAANAIREYLDQDFGWNEEVVGVFVGVVTGVAAQTDVRYPVGELDEGRCDGVGQYWPEDVEYTCNYTIQPLSSENEPEGEPKLFLSTLWRLKNEAH